MTEAEIEKGNNGAAFHERYVLFVTALLRGDSVEEAGKAANASRATAYRWLRLPLVQDLLREGRSRHLEAAARSAAVASEEAVQAVLRLMRGAKAEGTRLRAAETVLAYSSAFQAAAEQDAEVRELRGELDRLLGKGD